jgi:sigma-B regulation protein RsbU (phosphoserine phosphatase)
VDSRDELGAQAGHLNEALDDVWLIHQQRDHYLAQKLKIEGELSVAKDIQMGMVPRMFPNAPDWPECSLFALLHSAREVGGDFYDFYLDDEGKLIFTIGDVSDKGVPAALFMAQTRTLLRGMCAPGQMPHELLGRVNSVLADNNGLSMFVTIFCAKLDLATGELWFSNAGHNPPLLIRQGTRVEWLKLPPGLVLGAFPATTFTTEKIILAPGDGILAYTDGVTEALNVVGRMYSEQRLVETLQGMSGATPRQIVDGLQASVEAFALGAAQSDDVTLIAIKYWGRNRELIESSTSGSMTSWLEADDHDDPRPHGFLPAMNE